MRLPAVFILVMFTFPVQVPGQRVQKSVVIHNGYEGNKLVRNHTVVHYYHFTREKAEGVVTVDRVVEFAANKEQAQYATLVETDTLFTFSGTIHRGKMTGIFPSFPPGNVFFAKTYLDGEKTGPFRGYYHSGELFCEGVLLDGVKTGPYRQYYANGQLSLSQNFLDLNENVLHHESFYLNGQLHHRGYYHSGNKVNEWHYFDRDGILCKTEYYNKYGRLKQIKDTDPGVPFPGHSSR